MTDRRAEHFYQSEIETIIEEGRADPSKTGMGTTLTGAFSAGNDFVCSGRLAGLSLPPWTLLQLTRDQTYSQLLQIWSDSTRVRLIIAVHSHRCYRSRRREANVTVRHCR